MAVPSVDRQTFLANLRQSGLVGEEQLAAVAGELPESPRGRVVARALVARGLLTKFQAEQLLAGRTGGFFLGPYRILEQLGQGGMGRVYKAEHRSLGRTVALKVLAPSVLKSAKAQALFLREVQAVARLVHPNIVAALDAGQAGGRHYLVLEYVNGLNLDQLVRREGPLPVGQACEFIRQVALGLQHAGEQGLVHRDIKPSNVLLQRAGGAGQEAYGLAKLGDFGLVRLGEPGSAPGAGPGTIETKANTVMGTPDYLSPEQARDLHKTDMRSDLYSLGCTFYYLLTGRVPYPGGSTLEKLIRHSTEEAEPVERLRPGVPPAVAAIVRRLMAKKPEERFQTPAELASALAPFAVNGAGALPAGSPAAPFVDPLATPTVEVEPVLDDGKEGGLDVLTTAGEAQAVISTLSEEPALVVDPGSSPRRSAATAGRRRYRVALFWALGIVGALLASGVAFGLLTR
jgi:eukaryotic-like serine/threonine-protein kinase